MRKPTAGGGDQYCRDREGGREGGHAQQVGEPREARPAQARGLGPGPLRGSLAHDPEQPLGNGGRERRVEGARDRAAGEDEALEALHQGGVFRHGVPDGTAPGGRQHAVGVAHDVVVADRQRRRVLLGSVTHTSVPGLGACLGACARGLRAGGRGIVSCGWPSMRACNSRRALANRLMTVPIGVWVISAASL